MAGGVILVMKGVFEEGELVGDGFRPAVWVVNNGDFSVGGEVSAAFGDLAGGFDCRVLRNVNLTARAEACPKWNNDDDKEESRFAHMKSIS